MPEKNISRRQALKIILATAGGLSAAAFLPSKWLKPVVSTGVLPVHATTSALHSMFDAFDGGGDNTDIAVFVAIPIIKSAVQLMGVGIGAGVLPIASPTYHGTPVQGVNVTLNSITVPLGNTISMGSGGKSQWRSSGGSWQDLILPITVTTGNNPAFIPADSWQGIADFYQFNVRDSGDNLIIGPWVFHFSSAGCSPSTIDISVTVAS